MIIAERMVEKKINNSLPFPGLVPLGDSRIYVDPLYTNILKEMGLCDFESIMNFGGGKVYKRNRYRSVVRIEHPEKGGFFLKRHFSPSIKESIKAWCFFKMPKSSARLEIEAISALQKVGINSMKPIAIGEERKKLVEGPSFLITEEIKDGTKLEDFIPRRFPRCNHDTSARRRLIQELAELARRMHGAGIHHRDFYLGHILITGDIPEFTLRVIDLQRVRQVNGLGWHWRVKDISQLLYTTPDVVTSTEKLRFFLIYRGHERLTSEDRRFIRDVVAKTKRTARHVIRKRARKEKRVK